MQAEWIAIDIREDSQTKRCGCTIPLQNTKQRNGNRYRDRGSLLVSVYGALLFLSLWGPFGFGFNKTAEPFRRPCSNRTKTGFVSKWEENQTWLRFPLSFPLKVLATTRLPAHVSLWVLVLKSTDKERFADIHGQYYGHQARSERRKLIKTVCSRNIAKKYCLPFSVWFA